MAGLSGAKHSPGGKLHRENGLKIHIDNHELNLRFWFHLTSTRGSMDMATFKDTTDGTIREELWISDRMAISAV
jgi:hypothetical protein